MTNILGIDVGVKNLALSIVECDKVEKFKIKNYWLIDLNEKPKCKECDKPSIKFNFNLGEIIYCCKAHADNMTKKIKERNIEEKVNYLIKKLDEILINTNYSLVVIENQPSFRSPHMKSIQIALLTYFLMKNKNVKFQNPSSKVYNHKFEKVNKNYLYRETKKFGIMLAEKLFDLKEIKEKYRKIDDICDSLLICVSEFMEHKPPKLIAPFIKTKN